MTPQRCPACDSQWAPGLTACPGCRRLVHTELLEQLAAQAAEARRGGEDALELEAWRAALAKLPDGAPQATKIQRRVRTLEAATPQPRVPAGRGGGAPKWLAGLGATGLFFWKAKAILLFLGTKAKLLLTGFASWQTVLSMGVAFGVYWAAWGWAFAAGLVLSIYVHELGHVVALRRYGLRASAPMFIPGVGAFIRLEKHPETPAQDARVGLAGPWFGLGASLVALALFAMTDHALLGAVAKVGAWINLFNLLPIWQLDGGRGFASLTKKQRGLAAGALGLAWLLSGDILLGILAVVALARMAGNAPTEGDRGALVQYVVLVAALTAIASLAVDAPVG